MNGLLRCRRDGKGRDGAALVESALVIMFMSLLLFGVLQVSRAYAAREILDYAAMCGARSETVGFNQFMTFKVTRVASIPNAGLMTSPDPSSSATGPGWGQSHPGSLWDMSVRANPRSPQLHVERARIPLFLGVNHISQLSPVLNYADWGTISHPSLQQTADSVRVGVTQRFPLTLPFRRAYYASDYVRMSTASRMEHHADLYLE